MRRINRLLITHTHTERMCVIEFERCDADDVAQVYVVDLMSHSSVAHICAQYARLAMQRHTLCIEMKIITITTNSKVCIYGVCLAKFENVLNTRRHFNVTSWRAGISNSSSHCLRFLPYPLLIYTSFGWGDWRDGRTYTDTKRASCPWDYYKLLRLRLAGCLRRLRGGISYI